MYVSVAPPIAFPLMLDPIGRLRGLGATSTLPVSSMAEDSAAAALTTAAAVTPPPADAILAAAAGVAKALAELGIGAGCGQTCIAATNIVNQAEPAFLANLTQYENGEITQAQAQQTYQNLWQAMVVSCSAITGSAGQNCISDRQEGACTWKATGTPPTPYSPADGQCWNWYLAYFVPLTYPPINAPAASASTTSGVESEVSSAAGDVASSLGLSSSMGTWLLLGAAAVLLVVIS